jgi:hypothetical protein
MPCLYCGKQTCRHQDSTGREKTSPGSPRSADLPRTGIGVPGDLSTALSLFELTDRRELLCVLCTKVIPNGPDQAYLRAHHGQQHVRRGEAVEDRRGLPPGAVRYFVRAA